MRITRVTIIDKVDKAQFVDENEIDYHTMKQIKEYGFRQMDIKRPNISSDYYIDIDFNFNKYANSWDVLISQIKHYLRDEIRNNKLNEILT